MSPSFTSALVSLLLAVTVSGCSLDRVSLAPAEVAADASTDRMDSGPLDAARPDAARPDAQMDGCVPRDEECDGVDEDCDGIVDEELMRTCSSVCGDGMERCEAGSWVGCDAREPMDESCNGLDDDCDSSTDESVTRACSTMCGDGVETCSSGTFGMCSAATPRAETCDGVDEDCDSRVDEMLSRTCTASCDRPGSQTCTAGAWGTCSPTVVSDESCNGLDDDCNGIIDDGAACATSGCTPARFGGRTYLLCTSPLSWTAAQTACRGWGYDLVTVGSMTENDGLVSACLSATDNDWWIGLSDIATEGTFVWSSGAGDTFRLWAPGQPNDAGGQDCVAFSDGSGSERRAAWYDIDCGAPHSYACEAP